MLNNPPTHPPPAPLKSPTPVVEELYVGLPSKLPIVIAHQPSVCSTPQQIYISFASREWFFEMPMFFIYKVMRIVFVSFWFYFSPFLAMTLQFLIPFFDNSSGKGG